MSGPPMPLTLSRSKSGGLPSTRGQNEGPGKNLICAVKMQTEGGNRGVGVTLKHENEEGEGRGTAGGRSTCPVGGPLMVRTVSAWAKF